MLELFKGLLIFISNFIIYKSTLKSISGIFIGTILSSIFEYSFLRLVQRLSKDKKIFPILLVFIFGIFKVSLTIYYNNFGDFFIFSRLKQAGLLTGVDDLLKSALLKANLLLVYFFQLLLVYLIVRDKEASENKKLAFFNRPYLFYSSLGLFVLMSVSNILVEAGEMYSLALKSFSQKEGHVHAIEYDQLENLSKVLFRNYDHKNQFTGLGAGKNLLVIQVESLQNIFLDKSLDGKKITPYLSTLVNKEGVIYFNNYHELLGFGNSSDAEYVSLHSAYPNTVDASYVTYEDTKTYGLPLIVKDKGYQTLSLHGNKGDYYGRNIYHKNVGFDKSYFEEDFVYDEEILMGLADASFFRQSVDLIEQANEKGPYFAFMISLSSHVPFDMPEDLRIFSEKYGGPKSSGLYKYMDSIHYTDRELGKFLNNLKEKGLLENTVVAIYGDHSAMEISNKESNQAMIDYLGRDYYYHDMQNVPLILLVPGLENNIKIDQLGSQIDFLPTIMNLMGWNQEVVPMFGVDLLDGSLSKDNMVFPQTHMLKGSYYKDHTIFEKTRIPGKDGGTLYKDGEKIDQESLDQTSKLGIKLIDYSNYLYENNLLEKEVNKFKQSKGK
ncbi:MAG: LTA synthase family protein [Bacillota bacterium]|nr:LTA synthase family protein [Bacillota bacterium]